MFKKVVSSIRDIKRLDTIVHILFSEGFGFIIKKRITAQESIKLNGPLRTRLLLEKLGPTFVKFGQLLSVRPDLVPMDYIKELEELQDNVAPFAYNTVKKIIEEELGKPINKIFKSIKEKPIASASVSQVHEGILLNNEKVAIKVQRPNIKEIIDTDIDIMYYLAKLIEKHYKPLKKFEPVRIVDVFSRWTKKEVDFRNEARNAQIFYSNFKNSKKVKIHKVYDELSTKKILVTEFVEGTDIRELRVLKSKAKIKKVIKNGFDAILTQVFEHGFFHADPHPGNLLMTKSGKIAFLDFGIVGHFNSDLKEKSINLFIGILNDDVDRIVETFISMNLTDEEVDIQKFKIDLEDAIFPLQAGKLKDVHVSRVLEKVLDIALKYNIRMPVDFVLLGKTILTIEGVAMDYDPNFDISSTAKPFINKLILNDVKPKNLARSALDTGLKYKELIESFPNKAGKILTKLEKGTLKVDIEDTDIKMLTLEMGRSSNRVTYGVVIAALVVGSSITLNSGFDGPLSYLAGVGFVLAMILGMVLIFSILHDK